jgi:hypothetical protein
MRTDAQIDRKQVYCPNASTLGYGKHKAQFGDVVVFEENNTLRVGRVAGRIKYAPPCGDTPAIRGHLLVIGLNDSLTSVYERWLNPSDVTRVEPRANLIVSLMSFLMSPGFKTHTPDVLRTWSESGFPTMDQWYTYRANQKSGGR